MRSFHLIFGLLVVVVFLLTGQYMDRFYNHLEGMADGPRMMFRSRHIYILFAGLLNLSVGVYFRAGREAWRRALQWMGSGLIVLATSLLIGAFFYEPKLEHLQTPLSRWGLYTIFAGTFFHLFSDAQTKRGADADSI